MSYTYNDYNAFQVFKDLAESLSVPTFLHRRKFYEYIREGAERRQRPVEDQLREYLKQGRLTEEWARDPKRNLHFNDSRQNQKSKGNKPLRQSPRQSKKNNSPKEGTSRDVEARKTKKPRVVKFEPKPKSVPSISPPRDERSQKGERNERGNVRFLYEGELKKLTQEIKVTIKEEVSLSIKKEVRASVDTIKVKITEFIEREIKDLTEAKLDEALETIVAKHFPKKKKRKRIIADSESPRGQDSAAAGGDQTEPAVNDIAAPKEAEGDTQQQKGEGPSAIPENPWITQ